VILVVVEAGAPDRASEALRAAIGLGLRGDPVEVLLTGAAVALAGGGDPRIERALGTLAELGRPARVAGADEVAGWITRARAVELWTDGAAPASARLVHLGGGPGRSIDAADLVAQILASDGPIVVR
jgi:hypothetical protein